MCVRSRGLNALFITGGLSLERLKTNLCSSFVPLAVLTCFRSVNVLSPKCFFFSFFFFSCHLNLQVFKRVVAGFEPGWLSVCGHVSERTLLVVGCFFERVFPLSLLSPISCSSFTLFLPIRCDLDVLLESRVLVSFLGGWFA